MKLLKKCQFCGKVSKEASRVPFGSDPNKFIIKYECGHGTIQVVDDTLDTSAIELESDDHCNPFEFQKSGILFAHKSGYRCGIFDEMGLGKTVQALGCLKFNPDLCPVLVVTKAGLIQQMFYEVFRWLGISYVPQTIENKKQRIWPGFKVYIVSYDTFWRLNLDDLSFIKTVILDEVQAIKNPDAKRTQSLRKFLLDKQHVIALSGTPIKNNPEEYFTILNILRPERFHTLSSFIAEHCDYYTDAYSGKEKVVGLLNPEKFKTETEDFIIRRTMDEVLNDMPPIRRNYYHSEIDDASMKKAYSEIENEFADFMKDSILEGADSGLAFYSNLLAYYARMRNLTGLAKLKTCIDFVTAFLLETDRKIVVFGHHTETLKILQEKLSEWSTMGGWSACLQIKSGMTGDEKNDVVTRFREDPKCRILIGSTLASGEGLNLQFCTDAVMLERQWNPANEEQAEYRFRRIGMDKSIASVNITYLISVGTIDEMLTELVELKRSMMKQVLDGQVSNYNENELMRELANMIIKKREGKKWQVS